MKLLMDMIWWLDNGFSGCSANNWGMLSYIPFVEINPSLYGLSEFGQSYVLRHTYLSALGKLNQYLSNACRYGIPKLIEAYSRNCVRLHSESAILDMNPEKLIGSNICFPEREFNDHSTIQWEESAPQEIITEKWVTNEPQLENEPEVLGDKSSSPLEVSHLGEGFADVVTDASNAVKLESAASSTNGASGLPKLDTSGKTSKDERVIVNDELNSASIGNYENEDRPSEPLEGVSPEEATTDTKSASDGGLRVNPASNLEIMNKLSDLPGGDSAKEELKITNEGSYNQQKVENQGEETSSAIAEGANDIMMETTTKLGVVNELSVSGGRYSLGSRQRH